MPEQNAQAERPIPAPILHEHEYLHIIASELRGIRAAIEGMSPTGSQAPRSVAGEVALREPATLHRDAKQAAARVEQQLEAVTGKEFEQTGSSPVTLAETDRPTPKVPKRN